MFDTEGFVPVASLCGVVGSPYWFIKLLIGKTGIYDEPCTSMQNAYICLKPMHAPSLIV